MSFALRWRHNERDGVSNHQPHGCLLNRLFRHRSKKTPKLHVTGLCEGNSLVTEGFPAHRASNAENVSIWWRHHCCILLGFYDQVRQIHVIHLPISAQLLPWHHTSNVTLKDIDKFGLCQIITNRLSANHLYFLCTNLWIPGCGKSIFTFVFD